ncbi:MULTISPECIES: hypothetical protein [unclassified Janthinobacterium]|uniref:hypothetical protein n=1 Tax=unclassified Janthinobacterium TaxID=2610881 RepID=UPI0017C9259D|nr:MULTISPECIES: hypothetical protein [unclassified Janthinobacterium]MBB5366987.1 hypothetical protein [Janthinobacterium sp. K2C7]MBB5380535.1 hypothetical protein [Janthinobacterium sp. K2Li3]MBB5385369.1 hypothetical protein [Janthinobacterium sp. K2E3]
MTKIYLQMLGVIFGLSLSSMACAGLTIAKIGSILVYEQGDLVYVFPAGGVKDAPACHGGNGNYLSFSMKRPRAKEYYAGLLMAFAAGKTVVLRGTGECNDQPVSETLMYFEVQDN